MLINDKTDFQPSTEALEKWLSTRKSNINVGGVLFPQFFSDEGNSTDSSWFLIACFGELFGLIITIYGGMKHGGIFLIFASLCIVLFVFCDFFFAVKLHRKKAKHCKIQTLMLLQDDNKRAALAKARLELEKGKFIDFLLIVGIISLAVFKVIAVVLLGVFNNLVLYLPVVIIYFIVAYVHIMHTGYYFAYIATQKRIDKDWIEWANGKHQAQLKAHPIRTTNPLRDLPIRNVPHEIVADPHISDNLHYLIKAKGVLTDNDIQSLLATQVAEDKIALFKECRKLQVELYGIAF